MKYHEIFLDIETRILNKNSFVTKMQRVSIKIPKILASSHAYVRARHTKDP